MVKFKEGQTYTSKGIEFYVSSRDQGYIYSSGLMKGEVFASEGVECAVVEFEGGCWLLRSDKCVRK